MINRLLLSIVFVLGSSLSATSQTIDVNSYLDSDFLSHESQTKETLKSEAAQRVFNKNKKQYRYPSKEDFWQFATEYWLVKNVSYLKWDRSVDSSAFKKTLQTLMDKLEYKKIELKVFIFPTTWASHFVLPRGKGKFLLFISQQFMEKNQITHEEMAFAFLEDIERLQNGYFFNFLKNQSFFKKLGKDFHSEKKPVMTEFERIIERMTYFIRHHGYSFKEQFTIVKKINSKLNGHEKLKSHYIKYIDTINANKKELSSIFSKFTGLYPGLGMKKSWIK